MLDLEVIHDPAAAVVALDPVRARLLAELAEPGSAASLAPRMGLARQKVNYHLRALEAHGLVRPVEDQFYGDRTGQFEDPFGHRWHVSTHVEDVSPEEMEKRAAEAMAAMSG